MGNIIDYIQWRGDLTFAQSPFNEVDNLILSCFAYVNLDKIENVQNGSEMTIADISDIFFAVHTQEELQADKSFVRRAPYLMRSMAASSRFGGCIVRNYINEIITEEEQQFSAMEILLEDGTSYVSFRGTDDTIVGWKEDFNMTNGTVPAQLRAAEYLNEVGKMSERMMRVGGHSKGGNLAIYASAKCRPTVREHVMEIYTNDGPGFPRNFFNEDEMAKVLPRMIRIIPEFSVFGTILEQEKDPIIIVSDEKSILQHDGFSWAVAGPAFVRADELNKRAVGFNKILHKWIDDMDIPQRNSLINELFSVIEAAGVETISQLQEGGVKSFTAMIKALEKITPDSRHIIQELFAALFSGWMERLYGERKDKISLFLKDEKNP